MSDGWHGVVVPLKLERSGDWLVPSKDQEES